MIVGLGNLGERILEFLVRIQGMVKVFGADIDREAGLRRVRSARAGASFHGYYPQIMFRELDLNDEEATQALLQDIRPDVIVNTATLSPWLDLSQIPSELREKIGATAFAMRLPLHLALMYKLMRSVKKSGVKAHVVNASLPDIVNPVLGKVGLAPTVGLGNFELIIPGIRVVVSEKLGVPMRSVSVYLIAHTLHLKMFRDYSSFSSLPYFLKVLVDDVDMTNKLDLRIVLAEASEHVSTNYHDRLNIVASSAVKNVMAILNDTRELTHAPGPNGLPGGYPIRLGSNGADIFLPDGLGMEEAVRINLLAQRSAGIELIEDDGTVIFTKKASESMMKNLCFEWEIMRLEECAEKAGELISYNKRFSLSMKDRK